MVRTKEAARHCSLSIFEATLDLCRWWNTSDCYSEAERNNAHCKSIKRFIIDYLHEDAPHKKVIIDRHVVTHKSRRKQYDKRYI